MRQRRAIAENATLQTSRVTEYEMHVDSVFDGLLLNGIPGEYFSSNFGHQYVVYELAGQKAAAGTRDQEPSRSADIMWQIFCLAPFLQNTCLELQRLV
jgi:hypothetical protein